MKEKTDNRENLYWINKFPIMQEISKSLSDSEAQEFNDVLCMIMNAAYEIKEKSNNSLDGTTLSSFSNLLANADSINKFGKKLKKKQVWYQMY